MNDIVQPKKEIVIIPKHERVVRMTSWAAGLRMGSSVSSMIWCSLWALFCFLTGSIWAGGFMVLMVGWERYQYKKAKLVWESIQTGYADTEAAKKISAECLKDNEE